MKKKQKTEHIDYFYYLRVKSSIINYLSFLLSRRYSATETYFSSSLFAIAQSSAPDLSD